MNDEQPSVLDGSIMAAIMGEAADRLVLGGFQLRQKIGEGGFGTVYLAEQVALGRQAVVKVMRASLAVRREAVERFVLEARLASRLDHPCAAHIYACGAEPDGTLWIAMELVRGTALDRLLEESGPLSVERAVPMLERLCEAVQAAHDQGIVHRDIKPANVMVQAKGGRLMPKLLDFGIAKLLVGDAMPPSARAKRPTDLDLASRDVASRELEKTATATTGAPEMSASTSNLTQAGQILGSPPYMAPEQWMDPTLVGPDTDQYALALLAFEALAGERACTGTNLTVLAEQALEEPLRHHPLVPTKIHAVLARAGAKEPKDRFADLGAFMHALRDAAGLVAESEPPPPALDAELAGAWMADAPQPVAEAIATVVAARSSQRVCERTAAAGGVLAHWLGILALACRSRTGRGDAIVMDAIRELRRRTLQSTGWIDLAVAICRGSAEHPELWAIPELAEWSANAGAVAALQELVRADPAIVDTDRTKERAAHRIQLLATVLGQLTWLLDYTVGRHVATGIELWMGSRGDDRVIQRSRTSGIGVVVLDADGARVVQLEPLVAIVQPMSGEAEEMFLFAGPSRASHPQFIALPRGFERDDLVEWEELGGQLFDTSTSIDTIGEDRSPYPGLRAFTTNDQASFVGREHEVHELVNRLRERSIVAVVGPSGAGKSSFLAAGLVPALPGGWRAITLRPGRAPLATLAAACERMGGSPYRERQRVESDGNLVNDILELVELDRSTLVLIIDQAEELFTQHAPEAERLAFAQTIAAVLDNPRIRVVLGVRDDFLVRLEELAPWRGVIARNVQILAVPSATALTRIVTEPARRVGYDFDDAGMPAKMVAEVIERPGALPLLAFAAAELWEHRDRHFKQITAAAYAKIGGVAGALVQHADGVVEQMAASDRKLVRNAFRRLLTAEGARVVHGRTELIGALGDDAAATRVVEQLLAARLVVSREDESGERIEIIHEALTRTWPLLEQWRREDASGAKLREQLVVAAKHWHDRGRPQGLLWRDAALDELERWRETAEGLTAIETAFADDSRAVSRRGKRRRIGVIAGAFVALSTTVVVLGVASHRIEKQRAEAVARVAAGFEERGRAAEVAGDHSRALLYLAEAAKLGVHGPAHDMLVARAAPAVESLDRIAVVDDIAIDTARWSSTDVLTFNWQTQRARLWDRRTGKAVATTTGLLVVAQTSDGYLALTAHDEVARFDATGKQRWSTRVQGDADSNRAGVELGGDTVISWLGKSATILSAETGAERARFENDTDIARAAFDRDAHRVATVGGPKIAIWNVADGREIVACSTPSPASQVVAFTPDGAKVFVGGDDGVIRVCDVSSGRITSLSGHTGPVTVIRFDPTGTKMLSASFDGTARLWNVATGESMGVLVGHRGAVRTAELSADAKLVATGGDDTSVRIWDVESATQLASLEGHSGRIADLKWDTTMIESAAQDGTIRRWNVGQALQGAIGHPHQEVVFALDVTPDGREVLSHSMDRSTMLWDAQSWTSRDAIPGHRELADAALLPTLDVVGGVDRTLMLHNSKIETSEPIAAVASTPAFVVSATEPGTVQRWSLDGKLLGQARVGFAPLMLRIDPTGRWIVVISDPSKASAVVVLDATTMREVARPVASMTELRDAVIGRDQLAIGYDHELQVVETGSWRPVYKIHLKDSVQSLAFVPDGRIVVGSDAGTIAVFASDGRIVTTLPGSGRGTALDVAKSGGLLAVGTQDGSVDIWDLVEYRLLATVHAHRMSTWGVKFSPDGTHVYSGGADGRVASWNLPHVTRTPSELARLVKCRVPFQLAGETVMPREIDYTDPSCR